MKEQLDYLNETAWKDRVFDESEKKKHLKENLKKNRFIDILPEAERIYIPKFPVSDDFSDYINAVPVDGFKFKNQFIVTQLPLPKTLPDFWRMIFYKESKVIVSLNEIPLNDQVTNRLRNKTISLGSIFSDLLQMLAGRERNDWIRLWFEIDSS